jgi:glycosyltransferase involved in cell wall biosynthesis
MSHVIYVAIGFPPAAKSSAHRMKATANLLSEHGCDVTVVTIARESWIREYGLDETLSDDVDPRIRVVELELSRHDVDPDIRTYGWFRARHPKRWIKHRRRREQRPFPEPVFGAWRRALEQAVLDIHDAKPASLVLVSTVPYTGLAAAWKLWTARGVPYAVDFRDAWSLDVIGGGETFPVRSRRGRWEKKVVEHAIRIWCVNEPIRNHYARRYPDVGERLRIVPNGSDLSPAMQARRPDPEAGLTFGYLGTAAFPIHYLWNLLEGWRLARANDPVLARSRLVFRGHFGWQSADMVDSRRALLGKFAPEGVVYGGPVARADVAATYAEWDALVFLISGGRYMTSGKVYEYLAAGLPIMSVHEPEHGALEVLRGYPMWTPPPAKMAAEQLAESFVATVRTVLTASEEQRDAALGHASHFERKTQMTPAVRDLVESLDGPPRLADRDKGDAPKASIPT